MWWKHYTLTKSSLFWVIFRAHRYSHLNSAPCYHQSPSLSLKHEAEHSTSLCYLLWPGMVCPATRQHRPSLASWSQRSFSQFWLFPQLLSRLEEMPACSP